MENKFILLIIILLICVSPVMAKSSDIFIDHLSSIVYVGCQGKDLIIKEPFIVNTRTNETITLIPWAYSYETLRKVIQIFGDMEPWNFFQGTCENKGVTIGGSKDACGILKCGDNTLDINQYTYLWNGERVDVPKETTNIAINNQGNLVQGLSNCNIKQEQFKTELQNCTIMFDNQKEKIGWYSNIANILISFFVSATIYLLLYPRGDKKRRKKAILIAFFCFIIFNIITFLISSGLF